MSTRIVNNLNLINGMIVKKGNEKSLKFLNQQKKKHYDEKYARKNKEESVNEFQIIESDEVIKIPVIKKENILKTSSIQNLICSIHL